MRAQNSFFKFIYQHLLTIVSCVLIVALGIVYLAYSSPGTTTIGEDISTTNLTVSGNATTTGLYVSGNSILSNLLVSNNSTTTNLFVLSSSTLGTVISGIWQGSQIQDSYIADNLTISNGTINNTPIGNTTPSTGSFTTLNASATTTLATTTIDGSLIVNTNQLYVDKASGRIGIGITTPAYKADIVGDIQLRNGYVYFHRTYTPSKIYKIGTFADNSFQIYDDSLDGYRFTITSSGNVGIGKSASNVEYKLDVAGSCRFGSATSTPINFTGYISSDFIPSTDNTFSLGTSTYRWANLYAASTTVGDLIFNNNFRIVETKPNEKIQALIVRNQKNEEVMRVNERGEISSQSINVYNLSTHNFHAQNPIFGTPTRPTGITIYDSITGQPYCIKIANGEWLKQKGECK